MKVNRTLLKWSRLLHVYAAIALLAILAFFSVTGITLNHPEWFSDSTIETELSFSINPFGSQQELLFSKTQVDQLEQGLGVNFSRLALEQDGELVFIDAQMPGGFISGELNTGTGEVQATDTSYGLWAWLNDLHKGRHTSNAWKVLLDVSSVTILLFCISGLVLLLPNKRYLKPATWLGLLTVGIVGFVLAIF